ncbi:ABC transporter ATP-binding protein [Vibrio alginolyticus]|uniref:ABC transporter ATP-binding protein n=1 Tax=Vibrio sp. B1FLJ16 TaxID=2751178 RepID=UPI0015F62AA6|nr:ABC transporter ATP-binding protein [Vibrio sp. B1FLJ16]CAD7800398.1 Belongs to the ABC transporter superfamily [Vibrio sp. B1FLJ16]CAD7800426.1 Belongs to the ABC transporter superfamily [Vibrio sp. B1FLJ16]CAE6887630.1 Belongs to the ABC transporter superfamily [Vibrio sp. B1FLJ16]CAE6888569.1 Belongs to the ABC transporter superfamily [Vibrio sp. B1FLJ16]
MSLGNTEQVGISIENLTLSFGDTEVLKGVNLDIKPGEFFAFLGPSGSGKSTLLRAIAGFGPTPQGKILLGDENVISQPPWKRNVGMVFQSYALWPHMTVRQNVAYGLEERKVSKPEIKRRVDDALNLVGLYHLADRRPSQLSGGQQQRVAIARTVVVEPRVLLLDEPLSNLDANLREQMRRDLLELQRQLGLTTIFVTHDQEEANTISDRIAVLDQGVIQQVGEPMELYDNPANKFVADFLGTANVLNGRVEKSVDGTHFVSDKGIRFSYDAKEQKEVSLIFRPQSLEISHGSSEEGSIQLEGKVIHREFLGHLVRYGVDVSGTTLMVDDSHLRGAQHYANGSVINLALKAEEIVALSD